MNATVDQLLSVSQIAERLGYKSTSIYRLAKSGELPFPLYQRGSNTSSRIVAKASDVQAYIDNLPPAELWPCATKESEEPETA